MLKRILCLGLVLGLLLTLFVPSALADGTYPPYAIDLMYVPKWGQGDFIAGTIRARGMSYWGQGLYIKAFIQVEDGGEWWPKPTESVPYVPVTEGRFIITFNTGGNDARAKRIALMLMRGRDARLLRFEEANAAALCVVTIERMASGNIDVYRSYRAEYPEMEEMRFKLGMDVNLPLEPETEARIEAILRAAAACAGDVRLYSTTGDTAKAYPIARTLGLRVAATAWLDGGENDQAELDALIALCNQGFAGIAIVGNEALSAQGLSEEELVRDIEYVRARIGNPYLPVTTAEKIDAYLKYPRLIKACNMAAVNIDFSRDFDAPDWQDVDEWLSEKLETLAKCVGEKPIILSEIGWSSPAAVDLETQALCLESAAWQSGRCYSDTEIQRVFWRTLMDESADSSTGFLDSGLNAKPLSYELYWSIEEDRGEFTINLYDFEGCDWLMDHVPYEFNAPNKLPTP